MILDMRYALKTLVEKLRSTDVKNDDLVQEVEGMYNCNMLSWTE